MNSLNFCKAQRTLKAVEVPSVQINIVDEVPNSPTLQHAEVMYQAEAAMLCDALYHSLPGGTFDRLLIEMLKKKASLFKVSYAQPEEDKS